MRALCVLGAEKMKDEVGCYACYFLSICEIWNDMKKISTPYYGRLKWRLMLFYLQHDIWRKKRALCLDSCLFLPFLYTHKFPKKKKRKTLIF